MFDNLVILNLQNFKRDSYISVICQASDFAVEDRKADAVAHLAVARSQNTGNGILGLYKREKAAAGRLSFYCIGNEVSYTINPFGSMYT